jgi:hypothetical protein
MKDPKTTTTGVLLILGAIISATLDYLQHGAPPNLAVLFPQLLAGVGMIHARDAHP